MYDTENVNVISKNRFQLAISQLYHPNLHGQDNEFVYGHYILVFSNNNNDNESDYSDSESDSDNTSDNKSISEEIELCQCYIQGMTNMCRRITGKQHPTIRNYEEIMRKKKDFSIEIVSRTILETGQTMVIHHTFWFRIFQRKYKKYYKQKIQFAIKTLRQREIFGRSLSMLNIKLIRPQRCYVKHIQKKKHVQV